MIQSNLQHKLSLHGPSSEQAYMTVLFSRNSLHVFGSRWLLNTCVHLAHEGPSVCVGLILLSKGFARVLLLCGSLVVASSC